MKPKIGIITWHNYPNFGSALQAYALHTFINNKGGDAEIINYSPIKQRKLYLLRLFLSTIDNIIPYCISKHIHYRFISFEKRYFKESKLIHSKQFLYSTNNVYDAFICGSDQIWAPNVFDDAYLLSFVNDSKFKCSYATSIGLPTIPYELLPIYNSLLHRINRISVREMQGQALLREQFNIEASVVCDPTLLLTYDDWMKVARRSSLLKNIRGKYILCYFLGVNIKHRKIVQELANRINCNVICLSRFGIDKNSSFLVDEDAGPREFLQYIKESECVITDSYHGLCFSLNFNKNFYVLKRFEETDPINQNSRVISLLNILGLQDRLIEENPINYEDVDYKYVNERIAYFRKYSVNFLDSLNLY